MTECDLDFNALSRKLTQLCTESYQILSLFEKNLLKINVQEFICLKKLCDRGGKIEEFDPVMAKEIFFGSFIYQMCLSVLRNYNVVSLQSIMQSCMQCVNDIGNLVTMFCTN